MKLTSWVRAGAWMPVAVGLFATVLALRNGRIAAVPVWVVVALVLAALVPAAWVARPPPVSIGFHLAGRLAETPDLRERLAAMDVLYDRWPPQGRVQVLQDPGGVRILVVDGRFEGASRGSERTTQDLLALAPGAIRGPPKDVFAIGLGTGRTLVVLLDTYRSANVVTAEVNPAVVDAVLKFFRKDLDPWLELAMARNLVRGTRWLAR